MNAGCDWTNTVPISAWRVEGSLEAAFRYIDQLSRGDECWTTGDIFQVEVHQLGALLRLWAKRRSAARVLCCCYARNNQAEHREVSQYGDWAHRQFSCFELIGSESSPVTSWVQRWSALLPLAEGDCRRMTSESEVIGTLSQFIVGRPSVRMDQRVCAKLSSRSTGNAGRADDFDAELRCNRCRAIGAGQLDRARRNGSRRSGLAESSDELLEAGRLSNQQKAGLRRGHQERVRNFTWPIHERTGGRLKDFAANPKRDPAFDDIEPFIFVVVDVHRRGDALWSKMLDYGDPPARRLAGSFYCGERPKKPE